MLQIRLCIWIIIVYPIVYPNKKSLISIVDVSFHTGSTHGNFVVQCSMFSEQGHLIYILHPQFEAQLEIHALDGCCGLRGLWQPKRSKGRLRKHTKGSWTAVKYGILCPHGTKAKHVTGSWKIQKDYQAAARGSAADHGKLGCYAVASRIASLARHGEARWEGLVDHLYHIFPNPDIS